MKTHHCLATSLLLLLTACQQTDPPHIGEPQPVMEESRENLMTDFLISKADNPQLEKSIIFRFDSTTQTFCYHTQKWIDSIHSLIPAFFAKGSVFVQNQKILPATTPLDFSRRSIVVQVRKDNTYRNYTIELRCPQTTGLPVIDLRTDNGQNITSKTEYSRASIAIYTTDSLLPHTGEADIRGRGNSTWWLDKKPYRLKLDKKAALFGMQPAKTWVLLANALDPTLLCNTVALEIARRMDIPYTNHTQHVELFLNRRYCGSYVLTEAVQVKKKRIDIDTLAGGFLAEFDTNYDEAYKAHSAYFKVPVMMKAPETQTALNNATAIVNDLEKILRTDRPSCDNYSQLIDVQSVIRYMLLCELVKNGEICHPKSVFAYRKKQQDLMHFGPPWDFDWAFGYQGDNFRYFANPSKLMFCIYNTYEPGSKLFCSFLKDPMFCTMYAAQWQQLASRLQDIDRYICEQAYILRYSQEENAIRWGQTGINYDTQITLMTDFLWKRIAAINKALLQQ